MIVTSRRGTPRRRAIEVAAIGSVGETTAPSTKAADHGIPSIAQWATTPTTSVVAPTSPIESRLIERRLARRSRSDVKKAAEYRRGGRNPIRTSSGGRSKSGRPGTRLSANPPITSRIGYGIRVSGARKRNAPTAVSRPSSCSSSSRCSSMPVTIRALVEFGPRRDRRAEYALSLTPSRSERAGPVTSPSHRKEE
jgi:hypothetical protein